MKNAKSIAMVAALLLMVVLNGCCMKHEWQDATCTVPSTCSACGATEGEALGHMWTDATCTAAKTCASCGATEGDALGHTLAEANYQSPVSCAVCNMTEGEPLPAYFEEMNIVCGAEEGVPCPYITVCGTNQEAITVGEVCFSDCRVVDETEGFEALEGYEWRSCMITLSFSDENANIWGPSWSYSSSNYYQAPAEDAVNTGVFTVNYNGIDYTECLEQWNTLERGWNGDVYTSRLEYVCRVPVGFDGIVLSVHNYGNYGAAEARNGEGNIRLMDVMDENSVFFRMK